MANWRRIRVTADPKVQGFLCFRVSLYWVGCFLSIAFVLVCASTFDKSIDSSSIWKTFGGVGTISFLVLPVALLDLLMFSNRICGPMRRIKQSLKDIADGKEVQPIKLRPGDFYSDVAEELNRVIHQQDVTSNESPTRVCPEKADESEAVLV